MLYVRSKVYIPGMREFQWFNWVVTAKVARLIGFEKFRSRMMIGMSPDLMRGHTPKGGDCVLVHGGIHDSVVEEWPILIVHMPKGDEFTKIGIYSHNPYHVGSIQLHVMYSAQRWLYDYACNSLDVYLYVKLHSTHMMLILYIAWFSVTFSMINNSTMIEVFTASNFKLWTYDLLLEK